MSADFLDTNVIVYLFDPRDSRKQAIAATLIERGLLEGTALISHQVVQETLNVVSRAPVLAQSDSTRLLDAVLLPLWRVQPSPGLFHRSLEIRMRYGYSLYDSLIVAAALEAGCDRILSEDLQHGQRIEALVVEDPFRE